MEFIRQLELIDPAFLAGKSVTIVGAGAIGSTVAYQMAQWGWGSKGTSLKIWDGDKVEYHNLPNQMFSGRHIGMNKATAIADVIVEKTEFKNVVAYPEFVDEKTMKHIFTSDIVMVLTDSMLSRKEIFNRFIKNNSRIELFIETRMDLQEGMVFCLDPRDLDMITGWENSLYEDPEAGTPTACRTSTTAGPTAMMISSMATERAVHHARKWMPNYNILEDKISWHEMHIKLYPFECTGILWSPEYTAVSLNSIKLI